MLLPDLRDFSETSVASVQTFLHELCLKIAPTFPSEINFGIPLQILARIVTCIPSGFFLGILPEIAQIILGNS